MKYEFINKPRFRFAISVWLYIALCLVHLPARAQNNTKQKKEQLQQQMKKLQDEIKSIETALKNNAAKKEKSLGEILSLQAKIKSRENLIGNINGQIDNLGETIDKTAEEISNENDEVEKMKQDYALMLRKSYENTALQNQTAFLLSAQSFYNALQRYNYILKVAEYRRGQAKAIQNL